MSKLAVITNKKSKNVICDGYVTYYDKDSFMFEFRIAEDVLSAPTCLWFDEWDVLYVRNKL